MTRSPYYPRILSAFDSAFDALHTSRLSRLEADLLQTSLNSQGEDGRLREDCRFRQTPYGRWMAADGFLANDVLAREFQRSRLPARSLQAALEALDPVFGRRCIFCPGDKRFVLSGDVLRLSARNLSKRPMIEADVPDAAKFVTHLPLHTLKAAAASVSSGSWGPKAQEQLIETVGWLRVDIAGTRLNDRMFIARIEGHSMDDGRSGLVDGGLAVFELWPNGSMDNQKVLVRGTLKDPETGSYAVKKLVRTLTPGEGDPHVRLVSLNPDKDRFPDIEITPSIADSLTVVARTVQALGPEQYARAPVAEKHPGRRDIDSDEAVEQIQQDLEAQAARFFRDAVVPRDTAGPRPAPVLHRLVCLDAVAGGLHLEIGPIPDLRQMIKKLDVKGQGWSSRLLSSNVRSRRVRVSIPPGSGPWSWTATDFEDDPEIDVSFLDEPALLPDTVYVFRIEPDGDGYLVATRRVSPWQSYRILFHRGMDPDQKPNGPARSLQKPLNSKLLQVEQVDEEWHLATLRIPEEPSLELLEWLRCLGLEPGLPQPGASWAFTQPAQWSTTANGDSFPCFAASTPILLEIQGMENEVAGETKLFYRGTDTEGWLDLPAGERVCVELSDLPVGPYACKLLHRRRRVEPLFLAFEVIPSWPDPPKSGWELKIHGKAVDGARHVAGPETDLKWLGAKHEVLHLHGPPGWIVDAQWACPVPHWLGRLELDAEGILDTVDLGRLVTGRVQNLQPANLTLSLRELGRAYIPHEPGRALSDVRSVLQGLVSQSLEKVRAAPGKYLQHLSFFQKVSAQLGYMADIVDLPESLEPPLHAAVATLARVERKSIGLTRSISSLLIMIESVDSELPQETRAWLESLCDRWNLRDLILSDGAVWSIFRRRSRRRLTTLLLEDAATSDEACEQFLGELEGL